MRGVPRRTRMNAMRQLSLLSAVLMGSLAAYAFARLRAPGRDFVFILVLSTMLLPSQVTLIPRYIIFNALKMIDTYGPLVLPGWRRVIVV